MPSPEFLQKNRLMLAVILFTAIINLGLSFTGTTSTVACTVAGMFEKTYAATEWTTTPTN